MRVKSQAVRAVLALGGGTTLAVAASWQQSSCLAFSAPLEDKLPKTAVVAKVACTTPKESFLLRLKIIARVAYLLVQVIIPLGWAALLHCIHPRLCPLTILHDMLYKVFISSGPCFLKLGQWAATRPDIFGKEFCSLVAQLQESAPTHTWAESLAELKRSGIPLEKLTNISKTPVHSGCIAQVHEGYYEGRKVAIKVMHPGILESIEIDLGVIKACVAFVDFIIPQSEWLSLGSCFEEFKALMKVQLDLRVEAANLTRFRENFKDIQGIRFPKPILKSQSVLVEEFMEGCSVREYMNGTITASPAEYRKVAKLGCKAFFKMVFCDNFVHADLHPGNILVSKDNHGEPILVILDPGLVSSLKKVDKKNFTELFSAVCVGDGHLAAELMIAGSEYHRCRDAANFKSAMQSIIDRVSIHKNRSFALKDIKIGEVLNDALIAVRQNCVKLDPNFTQLIISIIVLEGMGRSLWPEMNIFTVSIPFLIPNIEKTDVKRLIPIIKKMYT
eukprot:TRINITY_DN17620_c0_g1_i1.p1 TRINITY_DN17620_c0_g1~~TRINITY_DN17620_c0_g1_i1.p1  ORF type:complete len:502 (+),score=47.76 TRINITY_DN17620_c0_g1_i1:40-1545(+)